MGMVAKLELGLHEKERKSGHSDERKWENKTRGNKLDGVLHYVPDQGQPNGQTRRCQTIKFRRNYTRPFSICLK